MRYLLSVLTLFLFSTSAYSDKIFKYYYQGSDINHNKVCSLSFQQFCASAFNAKVAANEISSLRNTRKYVFVSCSGNAELAYDEYNGYYSQGQVVWYPNPTHYINGVAFVGSQRCGDNQQLVLNSCSATCVDDPCLSKALQHQTFPKTVSCDTAYCPDGGKLKYSGGVMRCTNGKALWKPQPAQLSSNNACAGALVTSEKASAGKVLLSSENQSSAQTYCTANYAYTGSQGADEPSPTSLVPLEYGLTPSPKGATCPASPKNPSTKHPCSITTGNKFKPQLDWQASIGPLQFKRMYNSLASDAAPAAPIGAAWTHNYNMRLRSHPSVPSQVVLERADGRNVGATTDYTDTTIAGVNGWFINRDMNLKLSHLTDGTWQVINISDNTTESYDAGGRLTRIDYQDGQFVTLSYPAVANTDPSYFNVTQVSDNFGRSLTFTYSANGFISSILLPNSKSISYTYDASGRLSTVSRPGYGVRTYLYSENSTVAPSGNPNLLTGIVDEKGVRFESYAYDSKDRGISTEMAGGVEKYSLQYQSGQTTVTDPRSLVKTYTINTVSGSPYVSALARNGATSASNTYDDAANLIERVEFGHKTTYAYDLSRNLETSRTEAVGTAQARTITTEWHAALPVPVKITEPGRVTEFTYDTAGNVLTRKVTDTGVTPNVSRTWTYTYNSAGQMLTETTPANETTTYAYDAANGNLLSITNVLSQAITYSNYTADGLPGQIKRINDRTFNFTYDDAGRVVTQSEALANPGMFSPNGSTGFFRWPQWLVNLINGWCQALGISSPFSGGTDTPSTMSYPSLTLATGSAVTSYGYDAAGQLTTVTLPDGDIITYSYNDAHRLTSVQDSLGNTTSYTLNDAGDVTETNNSDPNGVLARKTRQVYNNLGLLTDVIGNNGQQQTYSYDDLDNLTESKDVQNRAYSSAYDALNRKISDTDPATGVISYTYNALDQLLTVKDARNNTTTYTPNAFGETVQVQSPDTGTTTRSYDNGRLTSAVDARNISHSYTYDDLGRIKTRNDGGLSTTYNYDNGTYSKSLLTNIGTANGSMTYTHDKSGRVLENIVALKDKQPFRIRYSYTKGGKLKQTATPTGHLIEYTYNAVNGRLQGVKVDGAVLLSNVSYDPDGVKGWIWGASGSLTTQWTYDLDGRVSGIASGAALNRNYFYNSVNQLTGLSDSLALANSQSFGYDSLDRLTQQQLGVETLDYGYDANSNRTSQSSTVGGVTTSKASTIDSASNRIASRNGTTLQYLPTGQIAQDEERTYTYDAAGRLSAIQKGMVGMSNFYDGLGQRVKKVSGSTVTYFVYDEAGQLLGEYNATGQMLREYVWLGNRVVGLLSAQQPGKVLQVHTDHLGTVRAVSDGATVLWRWEGDAFGNVLPNEDVDANGQAFTMPLRHPGQYYDPESGLFYNYYRDYDPASGRYVESDPIGLKGGLNTYGYVKGRPVQAVDKFGLQTLLITTTDYGFGSHSALYINTPGQSPFLYDPGGSYQGNTRGSGGFFEGDEANLQTYLGYQRSTGSGVGTTNIPLTPAQEGQLINNITDDDHYDPGPLNCANGVSSELIAVGACRGKIKKTMYPGKLKSQAEDCPAPLPKKRLPK